MTLQTTGTLSITDIVGEFGGTAPHGLQEYYGVDVAIPTSGPISILDFYGASAIPEPSFIPGTTYIKGSDPLQITFLIIPEVGISYSLQDFSGFFNDIGGSTRALIPIDYVVVPPPDPNNVYIYLNIDDSGSMSDDQGGGETFAEWVEIATESFLLDMPNDVYVRVQYYHDGTVIDQVMDNTLRSQIKTIIQQPALGGTPLYDNILNSVNHVVSNAGTRQFRSVIGQTDGVNTFGNEYADVGSTIISTAATNNVIMNLFATGTAGDPLLRNIPNSPSVSALGSSYYESISREEQISSFRGIAARISRDTGLLTCKIAVDGNPASPALSSVEYPTGLPTGKYIGTITASNTAQSFTQTEFFRLFV